MKLPICLLMLLVYLSTPQDVRAQETADTETITSPETYVEEQQAIESSTLPSVEEASVEVTTLQQNDEATTVPSEKETATESTEVEMASAGPAITSIVPPEEVLLQNETVVVNVLPAEESVTSTTTEATTLASTTGISSLNETVNLPPADETFTTTTTEGATSASTTSTSSFSETTVAVVQTEATVTTTESPRSTETTTEASTTAKQSVETTTVETTATFYTSEQRPTVPVTTASTMPPHECVTSMSCADPNAHCVSVGERNMCICRMGFQKNARHICVAVATTQAPSTTTYVSSTNPTTSATYVPAVTPSSNAGLGHKKIPVRRAQDLSSDEELDVVSIGLRPPVSVVEWLLESDLLFRSSVAKVLTDAGFQTLLDDQLEHINISPEQVLYIAPSPQYVNDELLVSILVENSEEIPIKPYSHSGTIARHKRALGAFNTTIPKYFPAIWIVRSLRLNQEILEQSLNQTVSTLYGGEVPRKLFQFEQYASIGLLEWRLDILIPVLLAVTLLLMVILSLVCIKAKKRTTATWDPPAGIIFGKKVQKELKEEREDPLGSASKMNSSGQNLATDEQCREGEDHHSIKPARLNSEDDVWVVPYEDGPSDISRNAIRAQFEDTKL